MTEPYDYEETPFPADAPLSVVSGDDVEDVYGAPPSFADQPVPRVSIAAFCEIPETAALVTTCASDRRMARAHVSVDMGGLPAAIERFHDEGTPNLVLVESGMRGRGLFEQLESLANVCDAETKVIVIGATNDIGLYRELKRRGVSEYLVPPLTPVHLIRAIAALFVDPEEPYAGKTAAFIGAKGGCGASTIAHNVAWCVAELARIDATIVDLDLPFGTAGLDFNQDASQGVADALSQPERVDMVLLDRLLTRCTERLSLFAAPASLDRQWELGPEAYEVVIEAVRKTVPIVVLDLPHIWTPWIKTILFGADDVVVVTTPELAALRNAKNMYELVKAARPNDAAPKVVLNMVGVPKRPEIPVKEFADALGRAPDHVIAFEPQLFGQAANNGQMIGQVKADHKIALTLSEIASQIVGRPAQRKSQGSLFKKLLSRGA